MMKRRRANGLKGEKMETNENKAQKTLTQKILMGTGIVLCVLFGFVLICNVVIIIKGFTQPDEPPSVFGVTPLVVLSGSMSGDAPDHIEIGDLIFVGKADVDSLEVGDVITFMQGSSVVTHRIIEIETDGSGKRLFYTKGDANNIADLDPISEDDVIGQYKGRIPKVGDLTMFMQSPLGMIVFIGVPLIGFIAYDMVRRQRMTEKSRANTEELEAELARLRALAAERETKETQETE